MSETTNFTLTQRPMLLGALQAGGPAVTPAVSLAASFDLTVGLRPDASVAVLGSDDCGQFDLAGLTDLRAVAAGGRHVLCLRSNRSVAAAGCNDYGECDVGLWKDIVAVGAMWLVSYGLLANGRCVAVGDNARGQCDVGHWRDVIALASGEGGIHFAAVTADGRCLAAGDNAYGECEVGGWSDITAVAVGSGWTLGLKRDGSCVVVGDNYYGQCAVSGWSGVVAVCATGEASLGLKADGTVLTAGRNSYGSLDVGAWSGIEAIASGYWHTVGIKADGSALAVGRNRRGECEVAGITFATDLPALQTTRAKGAGIAYATPAELGLRGPYLTGCVAGRQCYELFLQRHKVEKVVTARLDSPYTLCAYEADSTGLTIDGASAIAGGGRLLRQGAGTLAPGRSGAGVRLPGSPDPYTIAIPAPVTSCAYTAADVALLLTPCSFELAFDFKGDTDYTQGGTVQPEVVFIPLRLAIGGYAGGEDPIQPAKFELFIKNAYEEWFEDGTWWEGWRWHLILALDGGLFGQTGTRLLSLSNNEYRQVDGQWRRHAVFYERRPDAVDRVNYYIDEDWISTVEVGADFGSWSASIPPGEARFLAANTMPGVYYTLDNVNITLR